MEIIALLFALSPILITIIFGIFKMSMRCSKNDMELPATIQQDAPIVQVAPVAATHAHAHTHSDEIAVVLAAAATIYVKSTNVK